MYFKLNMTQMLESLGTDFNAALIIMFHEVRKIHLKFMERQRILEKLKENRVDTLKLKKNKIENLELKNSIPKNWMSSISKWK